MAAERLDAIRSRLRETWFGRRVFCAWMNRCVLCLVNPFHGRSKD